MNKNPPLRAARVGRLYDIDTEPARTWLEGHGVDLDDIEDPAVRAPRPREVLENELGGRATVPLATIGALPFDEVTARYGTGLEMVSWVKARKELAAARRQEELLAKLHRNVVPVELVDKLFEYIDMLGKSLLGDASVLLATRIPGATTREDAISLAQGVMAQYLKASKERMVHTLTVADPAAPVKESAQRQMRDTGQQRARAALEALRKPLCEKAAPTIVELIAKRHARGEPESDLVRSVGSILGAHVDTAITLLCTTMTPQGEPPHEHPARVPQSHDESRPGPGGDAGAEGPMRGKDARRSDQEARRGDRRSGSEA